MNIQEAVHDRMRLAMPVPMVGENREGEIVFWNEAAQTLFGYAAADALGKRHESLIHHVKASGAAPVGKNGPNLDGDTVEAVRRCSDGSLIYVYESATDWLGAAGEPGGRLVVYADITHLKVQREARLIETRYRELLDSMPDAIVIVNDIGRIVFLNEQAVTTFGYAPDELSGKAVESLMPERHRRVHVGHRDEYLARSRARPMGLGLDLYGLRKDGSEFAVEISLSPLVTDFGRFGMSTIRDMTFRRQAEQKFRGLLEAAPDAIVIVDQSGRIVLVNQQTERLFGYPRHDLLEKHVETLVPERFHAQHAGYRTRFFQDPNVRPMGAGLQLAGRRMDGSEFPVEISLSPLETEGGTLVSASIRDISERRRVERMLQEKNVELEQANQAKDRFLASMSHELRTPLNAIIGFTSLMLMKLPGPLTADQEKQLGMVHASANHLLSLINDLLDVAKIDSGKVQLNLAPVACHALLEEVIATLRPTAEGKGLRLEVRLPADELMVITDKRATQQIVMNLLSNAIKFTDAGTVRLSADRAGIDTLSDLSVSITDTGVGISDADQARLFEPFSRVGSSALLSRIEGTGLGLYLCKKLAELLHGRVEVSSEIGRGSRFTLHLPGDSA